MDTRTKILTVADACARLSGTAAVVVTGYFDLLHAAHVRELQRISAPMLLAVVLPDPASILPQRARAELVAALRMIDYVVAADDRDLATLIAAIRPDSVVHFEDADRERAGQLKQHVRRRHSS